MSPSVAANVSTAALVVNILFMLVIVQSAGGVLAGCGNFGLFGVSKEDCDAITAAILKLKVGSAPDFAGAALIFPRVESSLFIGMGMGSVYAFTMGLKRGTAEVAVVHFMHAMWAIVTVFCHAQNAGFLPFAASEVPPSAQEKITPFVFVVGVQAALYIAAFVLSSGDAKAKKK